MADPNNSNNKSKLLHIAMYPWLAMGHIVPYQHLSNELAQRGHRISYLLPNKAQIKVQPLNLHPDLITYYPVTVPHVAGLPPGAETTLDIPISSHGLLATAMDLTRDQVQALLRELKPDFVIFDFPHWIPELGALIGFKTVCFNVVAASSIALLPRDWPKNMPPVEEAPPTPTAVSLRPHESRVASAMSEEFGGGERGGISLPERMITSLKNCNAISIRTCYEIEGHACDKLAARFERPVLPTGPMLPEPDTVRDTLEDRWAKWLDGFNPGSVVFCTLGSQWVLEKDQFQEFLLGFESTGLPFFLALKTPSGVASIEDAFPEGFAARVKGRGIVHEGWVQQPLILNHPSVGCFLTHCGSGGMWECLLSNSQIVLLPLLPDQIINTRLLAAELKVGVEVEKDEKGWFTKETVCSAIKSVMDEDSEVGVLVKKNHAKWKETLSSPNFIKGYFDHHFIQKLYDL